MRKPTPTRLRTVTAFFIVVLLGEGLRSFDVKATDARRALQPLVGLGAEERRGGRAPAGDVDDRQAARLQAVLPAFAQLDLL